jgi:hypothetical protein
MKAPLEKRTCPGCGIEYRPVGKSQVYHSNHCAKQAERRALSGLDAGEIVLYKGHQAVVRERKGLKVKLLVTVQPPSEVQNEEGEMVPNEAKPYSFVTWAKAPQIERQSSHTAYPDVSITVDDVQNLMDTVTEHLHNTEVEIPKVSEFEELAEAESAAA